VLKKIAEKLLQSLLLYRAVPSGLISASPRLQNFCLGKKLSMSRAFHLGCRPNLIPDEAEEKKI